MPILGRRLVVVWLACALALPAALAGAAEATPRRYEIHVAGMT